ncbi:MAG: metal-dependent hydrolase [Planctomycetales bacterium]|nr:metal-dependent hydrolase [Planctomycetales bacterium]
MSTLAGAAYGLVGHLQYGMPETTSMVAAGLCGIAGILPDADSDSGQTVRELMGFSAAVIPLLLADQFKQTGLSQDALVLAGGCMYIIIRFGLGEILRRYTVHRGMWHSIPAALIAGMVTSLIMKCDPPQLRLFKSGAVVLGYLIHLSLDELYSIQFRRGRIRFKNSFGTALKLWGNDLWGNVMVFAKLAALGYVTLQTTNMNSRMIATPPAEERLPREATLRPTDDLAPIERR